MHTAARTRTAPRMRTAARTHTFTGMAVRTRTFVRAQGGTHAHVRMRAHGSTHAHLHTAARRRPGRPLAARRAGPRWSVHTGGTLLGPQRGKELKRTTNRKLPEADVWRCRRGGAR